MSKKKYFYYISLLLTASYFLPLVFDNIPTFFSSHLPWAILWLVSLIIFYPKVFLSKLMTLIILYAIFITTSLSTYWSDMDSWNKRFLLTELYHLSIGASVISYYFVSKDYYSLSKLAYWTIRFVVITAIMSIFSSLIDPEYARNIIGAGAIDNPEEFEKVISMKRYGGGGYGTAIAFMSMVPILLLYYKYGKFYKKKSIILYILIIILALLSMQIFTNIIIAFFSIVFSLLGFNRLRRSIITIIFTLAIILAIPKPFYVNLLYNIGSIFNNYKELNYKFTDFAIFLETGSNVEEPSTGTGGRAQRYPELIKTFYKSPFWGCYFYNKDGNGYNPLGAHLYWMNKLTTTGLIGLIFFLSIIIYFIQNFFKKIQNKIVKFYYLLSIFSFLSYGLFKNISSKGAWFTFFVVIPALIYFFVTTKKNL